jgi:transposase
MAATTHPQGGSVLDGTLYVGFDLGKDTWTVAMTAGWGVEPVVRGLPAGDMVKLARLISQARARWQLPATGRTVSCYEAGPEGFWVHRALVAQGLENRVVDSASIEVNRRARRTKTDRVDARKLVALLVRVVLGEHEAWREVRVPTEAQEAARHASRERRTLVDERTAVVNQVRGLLKTQGAALPSRRRGAWWTRVLDWHGTPLAPSIQERLARAWTRVELLEAQIATLEAQQRAAVAAQPADSPARRLVRVRGVAETSTMTLLDEGLVWRAFRNRREVGGLLGFAPTHHASGEMHRDRGISGAGNHWLQTMAVQLAWNWVRWQPQSALTQWYRARFGQGKRLKRIGIVALARKLLILLWRYATTGVLPADVRLQGA